MSDAEIIDPAADGEPRTPWPLNATDELILAALVAGLNQRQTAEVAHVHPKTVQRRLSSPAFAALVSARRAARVREVAGQLTELAATATTVIGEAMADDQPIRVRLAAAQLALRGVTEYLAAAESNAQIADLEQLVVRLVPAAGDHEGIETREAGE